MAHDHSPHDLTHAHPAEDEPRQAQFIGVLALGLIAFLVIGALIGIVQAII